MRPSLSRIGNLSNQQSAINNQQFSRALSIATGPDRLEGDRRHNAGCALEENGPMKQYLLSVYQPDGTPPPPESLQKIMRNVYALRDEMRSANAWVFSGGLHEASTATVLRPQAGEVVTIDGPFTEGKEHLGGFTIIKAADLDAALAWGRKLARATTLPIEVRPFREEVGT